MIVKYSKKFPYAPYLNEDIGFEMEVPNNGESDPPDPEKVYESLKFLKGMAERFFKESNPQLQPEEPIIQSQSTPVIDYKRQECKDAIADCTSLPELQSHFENALKYGLKEEYNKRLKELS